LRSFHARYGIATDIYKRRLNVVINRVARGIAVAGIKFLREQRVPAATGWSEEDEGAVAAGKKGTENRVPGTRNGNGIL
jgi:hypothetical protein